MISYPNRIKCLNRNIVIYSFLAWFTIYIAVRTKFLSEIISSSVPVNAFVVVSITILALSSYRFHVSRALLFFFTTSFLYSIFLTLIERLPPWHVIQFFLSVKFVFVFLCASQINQEKRLSYWIGTFRVVMFFFFLSVPFALLDFLSPGAIFALSADGRGFFGVSVGSFFASRVIYSEFLLVVLIFLICVPRNACAFYFPVLRALKSYLLVLVVLLLILTFSRKEILLGLVILGIHYGGLSGIKPAWVSKIIVFLVLLFAAIIFFVVSLDTILQNLNENYVRFKIFMAAWDIFSSHFPFGSGPGTFGTAMSRSYTNVYEEFNVPSAVTGFQGNFDGPIFDLYFISFFAEYGLGAFLIFWLFFYPFWVAPIGPLSGVVDLQRLRRYLALVVFGAGFFVPVMGNVIGLIIFFVLGLSALRGALIIRF